MTTGLPRVRLTPGLHLLPPHFDPDDVKDAAEFLLAVVDGLKAIRYVEWADVLAGHVHGIEHELLVVSGIPQGESSVEATLGALGAEHVVARVGPSYDHGFGWLERQVKPVVVSLLRNEVEQLGFPKTLVHSAAALTGDPLEMTTLVERTLARERRREEGEPPRTPRTPAVVAATLAEVAAERIVERLSRLGDEELRAAFGVMLASGVGDRNDPWFRLGQPRFSASGLPRTLMATLH